MKKPKVFVGVSGGVDSSVALALLQKQGYDVTGVFLKVWHPDFLPCNWREERRSAMRVCATLGVPFLTLDCEAEYKKEVADYMINEYKMGRTPNPDVFCNKYVKFGVFLKKALEMGADYIATGHYAIVKNQNSFSGKILSETEYSPAGEFLRARTDVLRDVPPKHSRSTSFDFFELHESVDGNKDQSYFLYTLTQEQLSHTLFPIGDMTKPQVRAYAKEFGLPTATKKDSQGVCFLGLLDMKEFLAHYIETHEGDVLDRGGNVIGKHPGALYFTIGERHGFTTYKKSDNDKPHYVIAKDMKKNTITVTELEERKTQNEYTEHAQVELEKVSWVGAAPKKDEMLTAQLLYHGKKIACSVGETSMGKVHVILYATPFIASGQSVVVYRGDECLGGGVVA